MRRKVKIKKKPSYKHGGNTQSFYNGSAHNNMGDVNRYSTPDTEVNRTLQPVSRQDANIEAEKGEFMITPGAGGIPNTFNIGGKRHAQGGAPLNLQSDSFIFSDYKKGMKITDPDVLAEFGMPVAKKGKGKGYTPAEIAKKFDVNPYLKTLMDSKSDNRDLESAELSIKNNILKLGKLALIQESMKGFPQGIPKIAEAYLQSVGMSSEDILPQEQPEGQPQQSQEQQQMAAMGAQMHAYNYGGAFDYAFGGSINKQQAKKFPGLSIAKNGGGLYKAQPGVSGIPDAALRPIGFTQDINNNLSKFVGEENYNKALNSVDNTFKDLNIPIQLNQPIGEAIQNTGDYLYNKASDFTNWLGFQNGGQPSPEDMAMMQAQQAQQAPQQQQQQPQPQQTDEILGQVKQALEGGAQPQEVIMQLLQNGMPPESVAQVFIQLGMPQEQVFQVIEQVMSQGQEQPQSPQGVQPSEEEMMAMQQQQMGAPAPPMMRTGGELDKAQGGRFAGSNYNRRGNLKKNRGFSNPLDRFLTLGVNRRLNREDLEVPVSNVSFSNPKFTGTTDGKEGPRNGEGYDEYLIRVNGTPGFSPSNLVWDGTQWVDGDGKSKTVNTSKRTTKAESVPKKYKNISKYTVGSPDYDPSTLKKGDYVKQTDGSYKKVINVKNLGEDYIGADKEKVFGTTALSENASRQYALLEKSFKDDDVAEEFAKRVRHAMKQDSSYTNSDGVVTPVADRGYTTAEIDALTTDEIVNSHLKMQKRNIGFVGQGIDPRDFDNNTGILRTDLSPARKQFYKDKGITSIKTASHKMGVDLARGHKIGLEQATYIGYDNLMSDKENLPDELQAKLKPFDRGQWGQSDEHLGKISPIDDIYTDTSAGEYDKINLSEVEFGDLDPEQIEEIKNTGKLGELAYDGPAPYYKQDAMNMGNLLGQHYGIKKYQGPDYGVELPDPGVLYYDPARALAAGAEQAAMATDFAKAYAGPQATSRASDIAGKAMVQAANTLADYENKNVAIGNQYLDKVYNTAAKQAIMNAEAGAKRVADWATTNQQYDNSKRTTARNLTEGAMQAEDNRWQAQTLNQLFPQFKTRPEIGGGTFFTNGRPQIDNQSMASAGSYDDDYMRRLARLKKDYPGLDDKDYYNALNNSGNSYNNRRRGSGSPYRGGDDWYNNQRRGTT
jgi:hypothetical protein